MKQPTGRYGCSEKEIGRYQCLRTPRRIPINGNLGKKVWREAAKSPRFVDMVTGSPGFWDTRVSALWDDYALYIAFRIEEPDIQAEMTERDSPVYLENDIEIFIDGEDCYYEFQINALGTIYEVFYIWQDAYIRGSRFDKPEFELLTRNVDVLGGFQDTLRYKRHPRGKRWAFLDWDFPGLEASVRLDGTLNDSRDVDRGWTAEIAFPWEGMKILAGSRPVPPRNGDIWRLDFSRFEALQWNRFKTETSAGWSFNPHGVYDSHIPECFTFVQFMTDPVY